MIKITVDEGAAFDALSILDVKYESGKDAMLISANWHLLRNEIVAQIGEEKFNTIVESAEYKNLVRKNRETFHLVDEIGESGEGLAKRAHSANMERYEAKKKLQKTFFTGKLREVKL
jgi:hypothetical protein